ncbi:MAG: iron-containing alcohol dehydrogenase [Brevinema sp.]
MFFDYHIPTKVVFGAGVLEQLSHINLPGKKALIVTSAGTVKRGLCQTVVDLLKKQNITADVFDKIQPNPSLQHVDEAGLLASQNHCDFIIGLGGGSSIDAAKGASVVATNGGSLWDYCSKGSGKNQIIKNTPLPVVTISTTASTGTEVNGIFVISNNPAGEKFGLRFPPLTFPVLSLIDPALTLSIPAEATAYQGCDILFHAVEGYHSSKATPISRMYSLQAIKLASQALPKVIKNGSDIEARTDLCLANMLSGMVLATSSMTSAHSLEHGLSALYPSLPHGAGLIMLCLPFYTFWAQQPEAAPRLGELATAFGISTTGLSPKDSALKLVEAFETLFKQCNVANLKMSSYGIKQEDLPTVLNSALLAAGGAFNLDPRILTPDEALQILKQAWS